MKTSKKAALITAITIAMALTLSCNEKEAFRSVKIGTQTWMAENLNDPSKGGKCYEDKPENCEKYGRLYTWDEAMKACPTGWRLPSNDEWDALVKFLGGGKVAEKKLKAKSGWNDVTDQSRTDENGYYKKKSGNGTDDYGFSALPGGYGDSSGSFNDVGDTGYWWSATEYSNDDANRWQIVDGFVFSGGNDGFDDKSNLSSVRCVKEAETKTTTTEQPAAATDNAAKAKEIAVLNPTIGEFVRKAKDEEQDGSYCCVNDLNGTNYIGTIGSFSESEEGCEAEGVIGYGGPAYKEEFTASSTLASQGKVRYEAANLLNNTNYGGDRSITWCEGVKGHGIGERVNMRITTQINREDGIAFRTLMIVNGYAKNQTTWQNNSRVKKLRLYVGGEVWGDLHLRDIIKPQIFNFPDNLKIRPHKSGKKTAKPLIDRIKSATYQTDLSFEIIEVYPGSKFDDTCITGIATNWEYKCLTSEAK